MAEMRKKKAKTNAGRTMRQRGLKDKRLFTLDVFIIDGPIAEEFGKKNKVISRTIQIRGDQGLRDLHRVIFKTFDRFDQHMYEFQIGGKGPMDPNARRYVLPMGMEEFFSDSRPAGDLTRTAIGSLDLKVGDTFGYWFDFGDDWWRQVNVVAIGERAVRGRYPRITKRVGPSPPQYADCDEMD